MELRHLKYFQAVAELMSFSKAAARLHVTQPALSRQIRDLEEELGCAVFERAHGRIKLTPAGRVLLDGARQTLAGVDDLKSRTRAARAAEMPRLRIAHSCTLDTQFLVPFQRTARAQKFRLEILEYPPDEAFTALHAGTVDALVAVKPGPRLLRGLELRALWHIHPLVALPAAHKLARRRRVALADLRRESWGIWNEARFPGQGDSFVAACKRAGFNPHVVDKVESLGAIFAGVAGGDFVSYVAPVVAQIPHPGVALVPIEWERDQRPPVLLLWPKGSNLTPQCLALAEAMS